MRRIIIASLVASLAAAPLAATGCDAYRANSAQSAAVVVFDAVIDSLQLLDVALGKYADSLPTPSLEQLAALKDMSDRLQYAKDALVAAETLVEQGKIEDAKDHLRIALGDMQYVLITLQGAGVRVPDVVAQGIAIGLAYTSSDADSDGGHS